MRNQVTVNDLLHKSLFSLTDTLLAKFLIYDCPDTLTAKDKLPVGGLKNLRKVYTLETRSQFISAEKMKPTELRYKCL